MHRSSNRDAYEAKMQFNPEKKAELLAKSPFRRHQQQVRSMLKSVHKAQQVVEQAQKEKVS